MTEFELIARYFTRPTRERRGIGDDCALIDCGAATLAITTDLLIEHVHFLPGGDVEALGHKALAVNLSDLAATGATPRCFFLALALPRAAPQWLAAFARGVFALADLHRCALLGGDTTRAPQLRGGDGPVTIGITALGEVPPDQALGRGGAAAGDDVWLSGTVGDALLGLLLARGEAHAAPPDTALFQARMERPTARVELGIALRGIASAAIDVSDGLLGDLGHILERSAVGARIELAALPRSDALQRQPAELQTRAVLAGGDDYELVFTAAPVQRAALAAIAVQLGVALHRIGQITAAAGLVVIDAAGAPLASLPRGFDHFRR